MIEKFYCLGHRNGIIKSEWDLYTKYLDKVYDKVHYKVYYDENTMKIMEQNKNSQNWYNTRYKIKYNSKSIDELEDHILKEENNNKTNK